MQEIRTLIIDFLRVSVPATCPTQISLFMFASWQPSRQREMPSAELEAQSCLDGHSRQIAVIRCIIFFLSFGCHSIDSHSSSTDRGKGDGLRYRSRVVASS